MVRETRISESDLDYAETDTLLLSQEQIDNIIKESRRVRQAYQDWLREGQTNEARD